jgi:hypothetical protein
LAASAAGGIIWLERAEAPAEKRRRTPSKNERGPRLNTNQRESNQARRIGVVSGEFFIAINDRPPILVTPLKKSSARPAGAGQTTKDESSVLQESRLTAQRFS